MPNDGFPNNHVIRVRDRTVSVSLSELVQNNVATDTLTLDLDEDWDDLAVVVLLGPCTDATELRWSGEPISIPAALMSEVGAIDVSVVGYDTGGTVRVVTKRASGLLRVVESGCVVGSVPEEDAPDLIGQLVAAGDAANKAAQAANTAAGKANTAATKATDAATEATDAAGDATRAAQAADATRAAQAADAAAGAAGAAAEAARGNVLRGTLGPAPVLSADDAYATKPRRLTVHGATRQNLWVNPSGTNNGVTVTANADGSITVSGTATNIAIIRVRSYALKPAGEYTLSVDKSVSSVSGCGVSVEWYKDNTAVSNILIGYGSVLSGTFTIPDDTEYCILRFRVASGVTVSGTYRIMLNEGSTAEPWCPPGLNSVGELSVVAAGKNLLARLGPELPYTSRGITFSDNGDGGIRISGTATGAVYYNFFDVSARKAPRITSGDYVASLVGKVNGIQLNVGYYYELSGVDKDFTSWLWTSSPSAATGYIANPKYLRPFISVESGTTVDTVVYPQLELGSTATAYEPPTVTTTPIDLDGHTLCSLPDGTCDELTIDATGAVTLTKRTEQKTIDAEHPISVDIFTPASGTSLPYVVVSGMFTPFDSVTSDITKTIFSTSWPYTEDVKSRGVYRTWNAAIFVDERFTDKETAKSIIDEAGGTFVACAPLSTEPLPAVTLPTLPAPTVNVWADAGASGTGYAMGPDVEMEYERDVTIAFDKLQAQVSATTVREATNG